MSTTVQQPMPRYFCYACNDEVPIYMTPDPTCQRCNDQFVQEVESGSNDPRRFFARGDDDNDDDDDVNTTRRRRMRPTGFSPFDSVEAEFFAFARQSFDDRDHHHQQERSYIMSPTMDPEMLPESVRNWMSSIFDTSTLGRGEPPYNLYSGTTHHHRETMNDHNNPSFQTRSTAATTENEQLRPNVFHSALFQFLHGMVMPNDGFASNLDDYVFSQDALDQIMTQLMSQSNGNAPPPAPANVIESLPTRKLNQKEIAEKADCAVCKDEYEQEDHVIELECNHGFHPDCIKPWLKINGTCPVCRKVIDGSKDKQDSNGNNNSSNNNTAGGGRAASTSTNTISALFDTTRRLFGHGTSSETRHNTTTTSTMPGSFINTNHQHETPTPRRQRRFDPNSDYMNLDLD